MRLTKMYAKSSWNDVKDDESSHMQQGVESIRTVDKLANDVVLGTQPRLIKYNLRRRRMTFGAS
jgi:hypothetical protein